MKKTTFITLILAAAASSVGAQTWPRHGIEAEPGTRWWWMGSAVDSAGIARLMSQYAAAGIGTVEITPIYGVVGNEAAELPYLTPAWMQALRDVQQAAATGHMQVEMNQGTGWPFGGPEVTPDDGACKAVFVVDTVAAGAAPVKSLPPKDADAAEIASTRRALPDGRDEVIRLYQGRTRQKVKRAAPGGEGLVIDHFDRGAVARYLDKFDRAFTTTSTPYPAVFFNDSYEVYGANWTPSLPAEFETRRGYSLLDSLPQLLGHVDDGGRVLADYRRTLAELLYENFTLQWVDWCHQRGVKVRNQAHGSPADLIDLYAAVDIPETEGFGLSDFGIRGLRKDPGFTRPNDSDATMMKYASSAAHITGKPYTSSETFTWLTEHFRTSLSQMKPDLDLLFTSGINHVYFHGTAYSPPQTEWPGWKFYASVDMSPTNTVWHHLPAMTEYIRRCQSFLQDGAPDNDFLVYLPVDDMRRRRDRDGSKGLLQQFEIHKMGRLAPDFIADVNALLALGYDCDYISDRHLLQTVAADSAVVTAAGTRYRGIVIPRCQYMPAEVAAWVDTLASRGVRVIRGIDADSLRAAARPEALRAELGLKAIRRADADGHHYFIANLSPDDVYQPVEMGVDFADALWFDPMTGRVYQADIYGREIEMQLRSGESRVLRLYDRPIDKSGIPRLPGLNHTMEIDLSNGKWNVSFPAASHYGAEIKKTYKCKEVQPWTKLGDRVLNEYSGPGVYTTTFNFKGDDADADWSIELGDVRESAHVWLNGHDLGTAWAAPFSLSCAGALRRGRNELTIEVVNLPANRIAALDRAGVQWRRFKDTNMVGIDYKPSDYSGWTTVPSGLNSSVKLVKR